MIDGENDSIQNKEEVMKFDELMNSVIKEGIESHQNFIKN